MARDTLQLNELYASVQGEGLRSGVPTLFCRFSGCNMRCAGWPCDTQHAIDPKLYKDDPKIEPEVLADDIAAMGIDNICITGGEPLIQPAGPLRTLAEELLSRGHTIDLFSNGTVIWPAWRSDPAVITMMDWKLKGSGEADKKVAVRVENATRLGPTDGIKFVCTDMDDYEEALNRAAFLRTHSVIAQFWVGAAFGKMKESQLVRALTQSNPYGFRLNVQVHKYVFPGIERGI